MVNAKNMISIFAGCLMMLKIFNDNPMEQNVYLYVDEKSNEAVLIDCGCGMDDINKIKEVAEIYRIKAILLTHAHYDHIIALDEVKKITGADVICHRDEKEILGNPDLNLSSRTAIKTEYAADMIFNDGDEYKIGNIALMVLHTPGHTPGGVCYYDKVNGNLFSGDTMFYKDVGRTDFAYGDHILLIKSIKNKLLTLPPHTTVYPGHGRSTDIETEIITIGMQ